MILHLLFAESWNNFLRFFFLKHFTAVNRVFHREIVISGNVKRVYLGMNLGLPKKSVKVYQIQCETPLLDAGYNI